MEKRRIIYYTNELEDEFSRAQIKPRVIDGSYVYLHNSPWKRFTHFFWYRLVATPISTALFIPMPICLCVNRKGNCAIVSTPA